MNSLSIKGTYYYHQDSKTLKQSLNLEQPLFLVEESLNKFDFNAIQVWGYIGNQSVLLGYIPRQKTASIHFLKTLNLPIKSKLIQIETNGKQLSLKIGFDYSLSIKQHIYFYWWYILHKLKIKSNCSA